MKQIPLLLLLIPLLACSNRNKRNDILTTGNLQSQFFYVRPDRDTVLQTSHAAIVKIRKGTFSGTDKITIEIKEAYRPDEILAAGLTTTSNGRPLRSAGMIYFNATADGKSVQPALPVLASIPTSEVDTAMKIFKGEEKADGSINWVDPQPADTVWPEDKRMLFEAGKQLYRAKCASCHNIFQPATGPSLRGVINRGPWRNPKNLLAFIRNPPVFMASDIYTQNLKAQYGGQMMTAFSEIRMNDVQALLTYFANAPSNELTKPITNTMPVGKKDTAAVRPTADCGYDTSYVTERAAYEEYDTTTVPIVQEPLSDTSVINDYQRRYDEYSKQRYMISIETNGWYNVDVFIDSDNEKIKEIKLSALLKQPAAFDMDVYVVVPSEKVMQYSTDNEKNIYRFVKSDGTLPLPFGYRAFIFAIGAYREKIYYGITDFTIASEQTIEVSIKETTKDKLKNLIYSKQLDGVEINAVERKMQIKKKPCDKRPPAIAEMTPDFMPLQ